MTTILKTVRALFQTRSLSWSTSFTMDRIKYLNQEEANNLDNELFNDYKYSVDQLMELAGLSVANVIAKLYSNKSLSKKKILVCCGPGNNGGDGLVCARHLRLFGYDLDVYYPKAGEKELYANLAALCKSFNIDIYEEIPPDVENTYGLFVDALFGFNYKPPIRPQFAEIVRIMKLSDVPVVSIDIPSGWDVEKGCPETGGIEPECLISLTAPKLCAKGFQGRYHYLGGRFVPPAIHEKYELNLPNYQGTDCYLALKS